VVGGKIKEDWKDGEMEEWRIGVMECWKNGLLIIVLMAD